MMPCHKCHRAWRSNTSGWWGASEEIVAPATDTMCTQVACMACGTVQCHSNGTARGTCAHCHRGMLPGWSGNRKDIPCEYTGCKHPAVYRYIGRGKSFVCKAHGDRILHANRFPIGATPR